MQDMVLKITLSDILWAAGFVTALLGAWYAIRKISFFSHEKRLKALEEIPLKTHESRIQSLEESAKENSELNKLLCRGIKCLLTNVRTGDCIDNIKKTEEDIDRFLIEK